MSMLLRRYHNPETSDDKPVVEEVTEAKEKPQEEPEQAKAVEKKKGGKSKKDA